MKSEKTRADELVTARHLAESRNKAQALILAGAVEFRVGESAWQLVKKAGQALAADCELRVKDSTKQDVGRGALKLRHALEKLWPEIPVAGLTALDVGASTGGFTQVLLERGAAKVLALDVGTHQLHERLRRDPRVVSLEQQHVLRMDEAAWERAQGLRPPFPLIVTDLSFISLTRIIPTVSEWLSAAGNWVLLVKPQFELGPAKVPGGIVRKPEHHQEAIERVREEFARLKNFRVRDLAESPVTGGDGNKEFLLWAQKS